MEPDVDIILPVYNAERTLESAVKSILSQTNSSLRLIAIDDGSTDNSSTLLRAFAERDSRVRVLSQPNSGIVAALNTGLAASTAPIIARQDADDLSFPTRLEIQLRYLNLHPSCVAVSAWAEHIDSDGRPLGSFARPGPPSEADPTWIPVREPYLVHPFLMVRAHALKAAGGYRYVYQAEDADLYWRLQEIGELANLTEVLGYYRLHADSLMSASIENGRVAALYSELAGISASRRRAGSDDMTFPECDWRRKLVGLSSEALMSSQTQLSGSERTFLMQAYGAKLMDLCEFRPYELARDDCLYLRQHVAPDGLASPINAAELKSRIARSTLRLLRAGRFLDAFYLTRLHLYGRVLLMLISKTIAGIEQTRA